MKRIIKNRFLVFLGFNGVMFFGYYLSKLKLDDNYFQYNPVRTFFPALVFLLSGRYFEKPSASRFYLATFVASFSVFWNLDSGIVTLIAWALASSWHAFVVSYSIGGRGSRQFLASVSPVLLKVLLVFSSVFAGYSFYIRLRYGGWPDYALFFGYQNLFYILGYCMVPMILWHPWNFFALVYIAGLSDVTGAFVKMLRT
ncbi:MAG: hypothetical protein HQK54_10615, partial [Oligoflexales bacterium]|nr:hypothetical protein [Oligoflexales bacterium]